MVDQREYQQLLVSQPDDGVDRLLDTTRYVEDVLGHPLPEQVMKAGSYTRRYPVPESVGPRLAAMEASGSRWSLAPNAAFPRDTGR